MATETATKRVTAAEWTDLEVGEPKNIVLKNSGQRTVNIVVDTAAPASDVWLENAMTLEPGCDPIYLPIAESDKIFARVYSANGPAKTTVSWHEADPPA